MKQMYNDMLQAYSEQQFDLAIGLAQALQMHKLTAKEAMFVQLVLLTSSGRAASSMQATNSPVKE